jgi:hypothetical protein
MNKKKQHQTDNNWFVCWQQGRTENQVTQNVSEKCQKNSGVLSLIDLTVSVRRRREILFKKF